MKLNGKHINISKIAKTTKLSRPTIYNVLLNKSANYCNVEKVANALNLTTEQLKKNIVIKEQV